MHQASNLLFTFQVPVTLLIIKTAIVVYQSVPGDTHRDTQGWGGAWKHG